MEKFKEFNGELDRMPDHLTEEYKEDDPSNRVLQTMVIIIIGLLVVGYLVGSIFPESIGT